MDVYDDFLLLTSMMCVPIKDSFGERSNHEEEDARLGVRIVYARFV